METREIDQEVEEEVVEATDDILEEDSEEEEVVEETDEDEPEPEDEEDEDDRVVTFGDEEQPEEEPEAPGWVKKVRKVNRKLESENKRLKRELQERSTEQAPAAIVVGEKPTLKEVGYDDKKYEEALSSYYDRKRQADQLEEQKSKSLEEQQRQWQAKQQRYVDQKKTHGFKDFAESEELVSSVFDVTQQGVILQGADDSALVIYALGKNPKKLEELAKISDPVTFAFKVAKLEAQLKVASRKTPKPEKRISGAKSGGLSGSEDKTLSRLREDAAKTGDYSKILAYKNKKRTK